MTIKELLIDEYGLSPEVADRVCKKSRMKDAVLVENKLSQVFEFLGLDKSEQCKVISKWPQTLNLSVENVKNKAKFYEQNYGITLDQFKKMVKINFAPVHASNSKVLDLEEYYCESWGMTKKQFISKMRMVPSIVGLDPEFVDLKTTAVGNMYFMSYPQLEKLIKSGTNYPCISLEKIQDMAEFFKKEFGVGAKDFGKMLVSGKPISYSKENFIDTFANLHSKFGFTRQQFGAMMCKSSSLLSVSPQVLESRISKMLEIGFDVDTIVKKPYVLNLNSNKVKARYVMAKVLGVSDDKFLSSGYMYDTRKVYSRLDYLSAKGLPLKYLYLDEKKFEKRARVSTSQILMTDVNMANVELRILKKYNDMYKKNMILNVEELTHE